MQIILKTIFDALAAIAVSIILLLLFKTVKNKCLKYLKNNNPKYNKNKNIKINTKNKK